MSPRERRLRERIDRLQDERDGALQQAAFAERRAHASDSRASVLAGRVRELTDERDAALAALWAERDARERSLV